MKATHIGTCQVCGHSQKLPSGRLSKHGYQVEWSMFVGTCWGAGRLPYEQATDCVEESIERARTARDLCINKAIELEADKHPVTVWVHEFWPATWQNRRTAYVWRAVHDSEIDFSGSWPTYTNSQTKRKEVIDYGRGDDALYESNVHYANELRREAVEYNRYIAWQQARVDNWAPQALQPVA